MNNLTELLRGVLEGLVLEIISTKETYGYEITKRLNELGFDDIVEGTVYTILIRLEKNDLVNIEKKSSNLCPQRKFYTLNDKGKEELFEFWKRWNFVSSKLDKIREESKDA